MFTFVVDDELIMRRLGMLLNYLSPEFLTYFLDNEVVEIFQDRAARRFATEGDDASGKWLALTPATVDIRESQGFPGPHPINRRTDDLYNFITKASGNSSATAGGAVMEFPGDEPAGELADKFSTAQSGKDQPSTPARPVLALDYMDVEISLTFLSLHMMTAGVDFRI